MDEINVEEMNDERVFIFEKKSFFKDFIKISQNITI